ncbi:unnamed protein product [Echinostoma caproni]|uniref:Uncharacterized protein n=1 Tax=Echinostoma caproni TaxID=27848 RepID=A0A183AST4_9TREM|nr:unnamed protein product [Echinostoma caproni]
MWLSQTDRCKLTALRALLKGGIVSGAKNASIADFDAPAERQDGAARSWCRPTFACRGLLERALPTLDANASSEPLDCSSESIPEDT